ncbi:AAA family ATPase [Kribbia dieselivorans]|uniref:AAA family ATPase n=1 Tax=Kribbia dieselivorans TaxID=331526 RepID=UPI0008385CF3|nr:AAA family ATPase [Kribbia dieselivorans]
MQLHSLTFQGIGPFPDRHSIDFDALGAGGLFLLEGPTGAGKSTIIDAVVFALYGDVAGAGSSKARIVSTHLRDGDTPFVDLVVTTGRGIYRVHRVPEHQRRKLRGKGFTTEKAKIALWRLNDPADDVGSPLDSHIQDANIELRDALGLTREQFTQTVVLPQGQFATFLRAKPEARRDLLQDIFGTEIYARLQQHLKELAAEHENSVAAATTELTTRAQSFLTAAWPVGLASDPAADDHRDSILAAARHDRSAVLLPPLLDERVTSLAHLAKEAEEAQLATADRAAAARAALDVARDLAQRLAEWRSLTAEHEELTARADDIDAATTRRDAGERAAQASRGIEAARRAGHALTNALQQAQTLVDEVGRGPHASLVEIDDPRLWTEVTAHGFREHVVVGHAEDAALTEAADAEARLPRLESEIARLRTDQDRLSAQVEQSDDALRTRHDERAALLARQQDARTRGQGLLTAEQQVTAAATVRDHAVRATALMSRLEAAHQTERTRRESVATAQAQHDQARSVWLDGLSGTLARELVDGQPCSVCGSTTHPEPSLPTPDHVDREEVDRLADALTRAREALTQAEARTEAITRELDEARAAACELDATSAEATLLARTAERDSAAAAQTEADALAEEVARHDAATAALRDTLARDREELATASAHLTDRSRELEQVRRTVTQACGDHESVAARRAAIRDRVDAAESLATAADGVARARLEFGTRETEQDEILAEHGFADAETALAARVAPAELVRLSETISRHHEAVARVHALLAEERLATLTGDEVADPTAAEELWRTADHARSAAEKSAAMASATHAAADAARTTANGAAATLAQARAEADPALRMAALTSGKEGERQMTLPTFVLLRRYEEVVDLANQRLSVMTSGRFSLRRTDAREGRGQLRGLGLEVIDHYSADVTRDPATLSGGETFLASLSLALGLADAVTAEAGGIELRTLFIDEGFGTLDSGSLDLVMTELDRLRDGGRRVGIVSHVTELKQRVAEQINITRRRDGTSTLTTTID